MSIWSDVVDATNKTARGIGDWATGGNNRKIAKEQFNAQMDESVQRRVADAQKAGIHPLFALGASVGASPTTHVSAGSSTENIARAVGAYTGLKGQAAAQARADKLLASEILKNNAQASSDASLAALHDANRALIQQKLTTQGRDGIGKGAITYPLGTKMADQDLILGPPEIVNPQVQTSKSLGVVSGTNPGFQDWVFPGGIKVRTWANAMQMDELKQADVLGKYMAQKHKKLSEKNARTVLRWIKKMGVRYTRYNARPGPQRGKW